MKIIIGIDFATSALLRAFVLLSLSAYDADCQVGS